MEQVIGARDALGASEARVGGKSAASWPAIVAGAVVAIAASVILGVLGSGLGLAELSPWPGRGASIKTLTVTAAIWLIVVQWISAALGGYIAGRLRTRWIGTHTHEVFFRDTAHGLVTWSLATVLIAAWLAGSLSSMSGAPPLAPPQPAATQLASPQLAYEIDTLFRPMVGAAPPSGGADAREGGTGTEMDMGMGSDPRIEALYIALHTMKAGSLPERDRAYLAQRVAMQSGVPAADAQRRVDDFLATALATETQMKATADKARKDAAEAAIYLALSMLVGAFIASVSAALGGRLRDEHP